MIKLLIVIWCLLFSSSIFAKNKSTTYKSKGYGYTNPKTVKVKSSVSKTGKYSPPHQRTAPNKTQKDNYSTSGNQNPWTGKKGAEGAVK